MLYARLVARSLNRPCALQLSAAYLAAFGLVAGFSGFVRSGPLRNERGRRERLL